MRPLRFLAGLGMTERDAGKASHALRICALPGTLLLPVPLLHGSPMRLCVAPGQRVRRGQRLAEPDDSHGVPLLAPADGTILSIGALAPSPGSNRDAEGIVLGTEPDAAPLPASATLDGVRLDPASLRERIHAAGIALPRAAEPAASPALPLLILDGVESEPSICSAEALLRARAHEVIEGGRLLRRVLGAGRVVLAIGDRMTAAFAAARAARAAHGADEIELIAVPGLAPVDDPRLLWRQLASVGAIDTTEPGDARVQRVDVATAAACWRAIALGEAWTSRIVSVTGSGVVTPGTYEVALGTPIGALIAQAGGYTAGASRLVLGGAMRGVSLPHDGFPILADTRGVLVLDRSAVRDATPELPCIRCGECEAVCPVSLRPQHLLPLIRRGELERAEREGVSDCVECAGCDLVCPSRIPLLQILRRSKSDLVQRRYEQTVADAARERHLARRTRLARDAAELAAAQTARAAGAASADAVQAALERARARRHGDTTPRP
jgi:electron transport complex protein RnfC